MGVRRVVTHVHPHGTRDAVALHPGEEAEDPHQLLDARGQGLVRLTEKIDDDVDAADLHHLHRVNPSPFTRLLNLNCLRVPFSFFPTRNDIEKEKHWSLQSFRLPMLNFSLLKKNFTILFS